MQPLSGSPVARALSSLAVLALAGQALGISTTIGGGRFIWTDRAGTRHNAARMYYELFDYDTASSSDLLQTGHTAQSNGAFTLITNEEDGIFDSTLEVWTRIYARGEFVGPGTNQAGDAFSAIYPGLNAYWNVPIGAGTDGVPAASFGDIIVDNDTDFGRMVGVMQAADFMMGYFRSSLALTVPNITVKLDAAITSSSMGGNVLELQPNHWDDWDVIFHELGHHVAENNNLDFRSNNPAENWADEHVAGRDNISGAAAGGYSYGKEKGSRLAWGEAVASTLGMLAVHHGNLNAAIPNLPAKDVDLFHRQTEAGNGAARVLDDEPDHYRSIEVAENNTGGRYRGEGDEWAVSAAQWDFYDNTPAETLPALKTSPFFDPNADRTDRVSMSAQKLIDTMRGADTFRDYWGALTTTADTADFKTGSLGLPADAPQARALATLGEVLEAHHISALPLAQKFVYRADPSLGYVEQNFGHSDAFRIAVFTADWILHELSPIRLDADTDQFSTRSYDLTIPLTLQATYHWVVLSTSIWDNTSPPQDLSKWYWSGANTFTYVPAPGACTVLGLAAWAGALRPRRPATPR